MNPTIETIQTRRSVRVYDPKQIAREELDQIIACGDAGPSGAGNRDWRYIIVQDPAMKQKLVDKGMPIYHKWMENMPQSFKDLRAPLDNSPDPIYYGAPTIIFVVGKGMTADFDCPMACQNIMLSARSLGIGSCWVYIGQLVLNDPSVKAEFKITEDEKVFGPIVLGYPMGGEFPPKPDFESSPIMWM